MKVMTSVLIAMAFFMACAYATPAAKNTCQKICTADYSPICGKPASGKGTDITFGNNCVFENYNCEKTDKPYVKASDGECAGKASVRL